MSLERVQESLTSLQETTTQLRELIDRLAGLEFEPGSVPQGTDEDGSVSGEISAEISLILRNGLDEQELLNEEIKFVRPDGAEKARLKDGVERLGAELVSCRAQFRKARLAVRDRLAQARKVERQLLLRSYQAPVSEPDTSPDTHAAEPVIRSRRHTQQTQQRSSLSDENQQTVGASTNVTNALRRTHDLIAAELYRSEYAHQTLTESSAALKQLDESYTSLDSMLASSRDLLGTLLRSQKSDTWYLQTALYMLMVTGAWLLFRRLLYGPMWWLVWLPLRVMFGVGSKAGSAALGRSRSALGESDKLGVYVDDGIRVRGLPEDDHLPTIQVEHGRATGGQDEDSMIDMVVGGLDAANEVDEPAGSGEEFVAESQDHQPTNPKKRMWEEPVVEEEAQQRDEL